jgi:pimeloyl-ACP methyl ester carboxylesterase
MESGVPCHSSTLAGLASFSGCRERRQPVLLLHELGGSSESWREVIPLMATDRRVIVVDMRCAGRAGHFPHLQAPGTLVRLARDFLV